MNKKSTIMAALLLVGSLSAAQQRVITRPDGAPITISLVRGDITKQSVDAIVNAANTWLADGGGVCGAIHRAGGPGVAAECAQFPEIDGIRCPVGQAKTTSACRLAINSIKYIIHTVGPDCRIVDQNNTREELLKNAYCSSLATACNTRAITSIAFPSLSTGIYGYNVYQAAHVAVKSIVDYVTNYQGTFPIIEIRFVLWNDNDMQAYTNALSGTHSTKEALPKNGNTYYSDTLN